MYKLIEPEVSGGIGSKTLIDNSKHPPTIKKLNFEFEDWLGDDILETFPCYIVTEKLKDEIELNRLTGIIFENVEITKSKNFAELYIGKELPKFYWAQIVGKLNFDDFVISNDFRLLISDKAFKLFSIFKIANAVVEDFVE
jgi:hypothetical protein